MIILPSFFSIKKQYNFVLDQDVLEAYYLPIIKSSSLSLYRAFFNLNNGQYNLNDFLTQNNLSAQEFENNRKKLESAGLVKTFLEKGTNNYFFSLYPSKSVKEIKEDKEFINLLKLFSSKSEIEKTNYTLGLNEVDEANLTEISETKTFLTQDKPIYKLDFESINQNLTSYFKSLVLISEDCKKTLDIYATKIPYDVIVEILTQSCEKKDDLVFVNYNNMLNRINSYINVISRNANRTIKLIRNSELFTNSEIPNFKKDQIFECYKRHNSEEYLRGILKRDLSLEDLSFISQMLKKISSELLNMTLDMYYSCKAITPG
jgi:replication initiation and membrane attachment protein DnaB